MPHEKRYCEKILENQGNLLKFAVLPNPRFYDTVHIEEYRGSEHQIGACVKVQVKFINVRNTFSMLSARLFKVRRDDENNYHVSLSCIELDIDGKDLQCTGRSWCEIFTYRDNKIPPFTLAFRLYVDYHTCQMKNLFANLYDDDSLTDFVLSGEDGSVNVHKVILAANSPVFSSMLSGQWRETKEGRVQAPGLSKTTLQHLKEYLYLNKLPNSGLEDLYSLAAYYLIPDMEKHVIDKIKATLTPEMACNILDFAFTHRLRKLQLVILKCIQRGIVCVDEMEQYYSAEDSEESEQSEQTEQTEQPAGEQASTSHG